MFSLLVYTWFLFSSWYPYIYCWKANPPCVKEQETHMGKISLDWNIHFDWEPLLGMARGRYLGENPKRQADKCNFPTVSSNLPATSRWRSSCTRRNNLVFNDAREPFSKNWSIYFPFKTLLISHRSEVSVKFWLVNLELITQGRHIFLNYQIWSINHPGFQRDIILNLKSSPYLRIHIRNTWKPAEAWRSSCRSQFSPPRTTVSHLQVRALHSTNWKSLNFCHLIIQKSKCHQSIFKLCNSVSIDTEQTLPIRIVTGYCFLYCGDE